jgi:hypothetical protein
MTHSAALWARRTTSPATALRGPSAHGTLPGRAALAAAAVAPSLLTRLLQAWLRCLLPGARQSQLPHVQRLARCVAALVRVQWALVPALGPQQAG